MQRALRVELHHAAKRTVGAIGNDQPVAREWIGPVRRLHLKAHGVAVRVELHNPVLPPQIHQLRIARAVDEYLLQVILLKIDECGPAIAFFAEHVETVDLLVAKKDPAVVPCDAARRDRLAAPESIENVERSLGVADRSRSRAHGVVLVEQHRLHAVTGEVDRRGQADRPGPYDDHRVVRAFRSGLIGRRHVVIHRRFVRFGHQLLSGYRRLRRRSPGCSERAEERRLPIIARSGSSRRETALFAIERRAPQRAALDRKPNAFVHCERGDHDRAAREHRRAGRLVTREPDPERSEDHLEQR